MTLQIGDIAPDFEADTTEGSIRFHDWIGDGWGILSRIRRISRRLHDRARLHGEAQAGFEKRN